ncbi:B3 domain-containing protein At3g19184-like isoform X2 [Corylus avellana]|uniref:B3 domain-containing protein At3g19184-like isoform X2 n=1 Tax=Corylus avellana TaxID=13451 RepID=UPI001E1F889E|nr:B3 domain-containing protein At3g19184-like isoform X2 [Corylus avellana]
MVVETKRSYEECRRQRLQENKKRLEELNLGKLAQALKASSPKPSPVKQVRRFRQPVDLSSVSVRRSSRVAAKPPPIYKEVPFEPLGRRPIRSYQPRDLLNRFYASDEARQDAIERAEQVESGLGSDFPTFLKPMLHSHVTRGFWLGLPVQFCKAHLPSKDEMITLVDEDGNESPTKYLFHKTGLSGGWKGFATCHDLVDGDALVFQLIKPTKFKVYIIRASKLTDSEDDDNDSDVSHLDRSAKRIKASRK